MASPALSFFDLNDFTPGIMQRLMRSGSGPGPYPRGAAQSVNTHRCIALPGGGLGPLPKRTTAFPLTAPEGVSATDDALYHIVGFYSFGPILSGTPSGSPDELHIGVEYVIAGSRRFRWYRQRVFDGSNTLDLLKSINSAEPSPSIALYWGMSFGTQRMNPGALTQPGYPVVGTSWAASSGGYEKFVSVFPDPTSAATAATNAVKDLSTTRYGSIVMHQNRLVLLEANGYRHGTPPGAVGAVPTNEQISFTDANGFTLGTQNEVFMPEFPNGYGAYGSMSSGELFLVKQQGGGVMVSGDINSPTVFRLPGVVSMGNIGARAASTPSGLLYPTISGGLYSWRGGDSSHKISQMLEDDFFIVSSAQTHQNERVFLAEWNDWVLVSNNWLFDTVTESWWRIEDPASVTFLHWSRAFQGDYMYGAVANVASGATANYAHNFRRSTPTTNFSWQSHPFFLDPDGRHVTIRELDLTAQGSGDITVTLSDESGTTEVHTFTVASTTQVSRQRQNSALKGRAVLVRIQSDGGAGAAPIVYGLRFGYRPSEHLAAA